MINTFDGITHYVHSFLITIRSSITIHAAQKFTYNLHTSFISTKCSEVVVPLIITNDIWLALRRHPISLFIYWIDYLKWRFRMIYMSQNHWIEIQNLLCWKKEKKKTKSKLFVGEKRNTNNSMPTEWFTVQRRTERFKCTFNFGRCSKESTKHLSQQISTMNTWYSLWSITMAINFELEMPAR